ncbi:hypothetical protein LTS10_006699 [Elasticomyces elasticus]|nr:hypothetical protein LTS10_006699 [Elasticomyces elasticus]
MATNASSSASAHASAVYESSDKDETASFNSADEWGYHEGHLLLMYYDGKSGDAAAGTDNHGLPAGLVSDAMRTINYCVTPLKLDGKSPEAVQEIFTTWWQTHDRDNSTQLVLAYFGHGGVEDGKLWGGNDGADNVSDPLHCITRMQETMRDQCKAHVLFILNTCHGGHPLGDRPSNAPVAGQRIVETIAMCDGDTSGDNLAWARRVTKELRQLNVKGFAQTKTVANIHAAIYDPASETSGFHRLELGNESILVGDLVQRASSEEPPGQLRGYATDDYGYPDYEDTAFADAMVEAYAKGDADEKAEMSETG